MKKNTLLILFTVLTAVVVNAPAIAKEGKRPNVVLLLADDLGYGEIQHLNPTRGKILTPNLDALAQSGMVFTDAHSASAVCTPTRYALLTGRYAWRTRLQKGVIKGGKSLISENRLTIAKMMKAQGYHTNLIGKWHLGMLFDGKTDHSHNLPVGAKVTSGPIDRGGFDAFTGFHHARQMNLLIKDDTIVKKIEPIEMLPIITKAAVDYIDTRKNNDQPFFLYVPWNSPHSPVAPTAEWQGKSGLNSPHADFVMQTDDSVGRVIKALKRNGLFENTIIISSADNGTSTGTSKIDTLMAQGHYPSGDLRGAKADIWDGGHRVHFFASWPNVIKPSSVSNELISLNDIFTTLADILNVQLPDTAAEDSFSFAAILKDSGSSARKNAIHHSSKGNFAIRQGKWKLILASGSAGTTKPKTQVGVKAQLYNMETDKAEQKNLVNEMPEKVQILTKLLMQQVDAGRSTPGSKQENAVPVDIYKLDNEKKKGKNSKKKNKKDK